MLSWSPTPFAVVAAAALLGGCGNPEPPQATYNLPSPEDPFLADLALTPAQDEQVLALMREAVPCDRSIIVAPAKYGMRWSDVDTAVRWGGGVVEMAVLSSTHEPAKPALYAGESATPERWIFNIITVADDPVTLTVTREAPPAIYTAQVKAGLFGDRRDIEERLLTEFRAAMLSFGAKPMPETLDD